MCFLSVSRPDNFLHIGGGEVEYRLIGSNDEWSENRLGNDITYTNISPGDYVFEIRLEELSGSNQISSYNDHATFLCHLWAYTYLCVCVLTILFLW